MSTLTCTCGFGAGTKAALDKHVKYHEGDGTGEHKYTEFTVKIIALSAKFKQFDNTGDKLLDFKELSALLRKGNEKMKDEEIRTLFFLADTDQDGFVNFEELLLLLFTPPAGPTSAAIKGRHTICSSVQGGSIGSSAKPPDEDRPQTVPTHATRVKQVKMATEPPSRPVPKGLDADASPGTRRAPQGMSTSSSHASSGKDGFSPMTSPATSYASPCGRTHAAADLADCSLEHSPSDHHLDSAVRLIIVRHGRSANKQRVKGEAASLDPELSDQGYEQAEALGTRLAHELRRIEPGNIIVASSPMKRCILTIRPAVFKLKLAPGDCLVNSACYEFGCAGLGNPGTPVGEITANFPEFAPVCFKENGRWEYKGSNQRENEAEAKVRAESIVDWIWQVVHTLSQRPSPGPKVFVLSNHQSMSDLICQLLIDGTSDKWVYGEMKYKLQNTGMTEIMLSQDGSTKFGKQNDFTHLRGIVTQAQPVLLKTESVRTAKLTAQLRAKFAMIDTSGDHKLDFSEMCQLLRKGNPTMSDEQLRTIFSGADTTNDGDVDFDEFLAYIFRLHEADDGQNELSNTLLTQPTS